MISNDAIKRKDQLYERNGLCGRSSFIYQIIKNPFTIPGVFKKQLHLLDGSLHIEHGKQAFINSNALHDKELLPGTVPTALDLLFDPLLISGSHRSVYEQKYIEPILTCRDLEVMPLTPSVTNQRTLLEHVRSVYDAADRGMLGYEFIVRNHLSDAWFLLF